MEPGVRQYLIRILNTLSIGVLWMAINSTLGIMYDFAFVHDPAEMKTENTNYLFTGHIHPGVSISGLGKQNLQFSCYYFSNKLAILPAFSKFSGLAIMKKKKTDTVFAIVNQSLVNIK